MKTITIENVKSGMSITEDITKVEFEGSTKYIDWKNAYEYVNKGVMDIALSNNCAHYEDTRLKKDGGVIEVVQCIKCLIEVNDYMYPFKNIPLELMYESVLKCSECDSIISKAAKGCFHIDGFATYSEMRVLYYTWDFICKYKKMNFIYIKNCMEMSIKDTVEYYTDMAKQVARDNNIYFIERS